jgi:hypothetical protein
MGRDYEARFPRRQSQSKADAKALSKYRLKF